MGRWVVHIDMDSFFVSCERLRDPSLEGKAVLVGGPRGGRGVVASASYEARKFGVKSGMPLKHAERLCPQAVFLRGSWRWYAKYSRRVYVLLRRLAPVVEYASIDEFYLDFTGCEKLYRNDPKVLVERVKAAVEERCRLPCTVALASNKYVAKIAGKTVKPNGRIIVPEGEEEVFLAPLPIERLHGAGEKTLPILKERGIRRIGDLRRFSKEELQRWMGRSSGCWLWEACRGIDDSPVQEEEEAKSVGHEVTFPEDTRDEGELRRTLSYLCEKTAYRLRRLGKKARTVSLKLRYADFHTVLRSKTGEPLEEEAVLLERAWRLFQEADIRPKAPVRLLGVSVSHWAKETSESLWLFGEGMANERRKELLSAADRVKRRFGFEKLQRASSLGSGVEKDSPSSLQRPKE